MPGWRTKVRGLPENEREIGRARLRQGELMDILRIYAANEALHKACSDEGMERRLRLIPGAWRDIRMMATKLGKICDGLAVTVPDGMEIDIGALAKGYTSDALIGLFREEGAASAIVSLGGNVQTLGVKPDGSLWNVAVQDPNNTASYVGVLSVGQIAVVTSGTYQRFFIQNGKTYHHLINPETGRPINNTLKSVTVVTEDGTLADCLSTAMFVLGQSKALNYWRQYGTKENSFDMVLVNTDNEVICTKGLIEKFTLTNSNYTLRYME